MESEGGTKMRDGEGSVLDDFRQGNVDAFESLFHLHQRAVHGWVLRIVRNPDAAEEVTVEAFWRIHRAHARFDPGRSFEAWARTIATHAALDWLRSHRLERDFSAELLHDPTAPPASDTAVASEIRQKTA
jgi:RNA polymerase sigma factor (sigma-70 family)